jgi:hypothetical protein
MTQFNRIRTVLVTVASVILLAPVVSVAQGFPDRDAREISSYVLTEAALAKYIRASGNLKTAAQGMPDNCDSESAQSLDEMAARMDAQPGAQAAIQSAGMTTREYLVFSLSLFQNAMAAWAVSQPGGTLPPEVSKANVDFYRAHEQALQKLGPQQGADTCSDRDEAEEEAEEAVPEEPTE